MDVLYYKAIAMLPDDLRRSDCFCHCINQGHKRKPLALAKHVKVALHSDKDHV